MPYLIPAVLTIVAAVVAAIGVRFAARRRKPRLFKAGGLIAASGLILLWLLPWSAIRQEAGAWSMPLFVAALVVAVSVLGGGLTAMARAATGQEETQFDRILQDASYLNDLP